MPRSSMQRLTIPVPSESSSSNNSNGNNAENTKNQHGVLEASVLSAYDLPRSEAPSHISITIGDIVQDSGPPMRKNRGRNTYRFSGNNNNDNATSSSSNKTTMDDDSSIVRLSAPIPKFFKSNLQVKVVYKNQPSKLLVGDYDLNQLRVWERQWVILTLSDPSKPIPSTAIVTTMDDDDDDENESPNSTPTRRQARGGRGDTPPTFRMALHLSAPYRPEISSVLAFSKTWFEMVDKLQEHLEEIWGKLPTLPFDNIYLALPAVPILAILVVSSPILIGVLIAGLPFLLPLMVAIMAMFFSVISGIGFVCASSKGGRAFLKDLLEPVTEPLFHSRSGQSLLYEIGPRPTPVHIAKLLLPSGIWSTLAVSLAIDFIGSASYLLPLVGEAFDLLWAPLQTVLIIALYETEDWGYPSLKYVSFFEEALPFTDIIPTATIGWSLLYLAPLVLGKAGAVTVGQAIMARTNAETRTALTAEPTNVQWA